LVASAGNAFWRSSGTRSLIHLSVTFGRTTRRAGALRDGSIRGMKSEGMPAAAMTAIARFDVRVANGVV